MTTRLTLSWALLVALLFSGSLSVTAHGQTDDRLTKPTAVDRRIALLVSDLMQNAHLSKKPFTDASSARAFDLFIKRLDPIKLYFTQADVDGFDISRERFDDEIKSGKYDAAFEIFKTFRQRVDQRVELAKELIDAEHDFSIDEDLVIDPDELSFPKSDEEARDRWRKRIKYDLLLENSKRKEKEENPDSQPEDRWNDQRDAKQLLRDRYNAFFKRIHQYDNKDVIEMFISAVTNAFDPHTSYMSQATYDNFVINFGLKLEGIGATLQSTDDGLTQIKRIVPSGPADKHGKLEVDDKIVAVGQAEGEMVDITWMKLDDVVKMIRGKKGTVVRLGVLKPNDNEIKTYKIVREKIELKDSQAKGEIFEAGQKPNGQGPYKIGVIDLPSFYTGFEDEGGGGEEVSTTKDLRRILENFNSNGVDALVLDLRNNGGGSLPEAIDATGLFIDEGPVVQVKDWKGKVEVYDDTDRGRAWSKPMVVLTSKFSASASEILAGAIQDYNRGLVIGDSSTHGKGTVQQLINLSRMVYNTAEPPENTFGALKITLQQFYRPNGDSTQLRGVQSDIILPSLTDHMDVAESDLEYPVDFDSISPASYSKNELISSQIRQALTQASTQRISSSEDFQREQRRIKIYRDQKDRKSISLNEEKFFARRKELNAENEDEKIIQEQANAADKKIERNFYLDEVFNITVDYLKMLRQESNG